MGQNMLTTTITPLYYINEQHHWENQPFAGTWPEKKYIESTSLTKRKRRHRTAFTTNQLILLENEFLKGKYLNRERRQTLSKLLNITENTVKIWFQNRRMRYKVEGGLVTPSKPLDFTKQDISNDFVIKPDVLQHEPHENLVKGFLSINNEGTLSAKVPLDSINLTSSYMPEKNVPCSYNHSSYYYPNIQVYNNSYGVPPYDNYYTGYNNNSQCVFNQTMNYDVNYLNL